MKICEGKSGLGPSLKDGNQEPDAALQPRADGSTAELRQQLVSDPTHEFTNAITAVIGYSELALHVVEQSHPAREWLEKVRSRGMQLGLLLNKLIDLQRSQHGEQPRTPY